MNTEKTVDSIPIDLFHEIFSRLPARLVGRCRCVSKQWAFLLERQDFMELFLTRSSTRPRHLWIKKEDNDEWLFYSSPQTQKSTEVAAELYTKFLGSKRDRYICYASGLVYFSDVRISKDKGKDSTPVICNPLTGRYAILPKLILPNMKRNKEPTSYFGFDPIDKKFKVLLINYSVYNETVYHILTLGRKIGIGKMRWRKIQCPFTHEPKPSCKGICINGVLFYSAHTDDGTSDVIVCFDMRSEKFKFIVKEIIYSKLINYKGKLGAITLKYEYDTPRGTKWLTCELHIWVLEDVDKEEWTKYVYPLPKTRNRRLFSVVGMTASCEIALLECSSTYLNPNVFYFNPERKSLHRVKIRGVGAESGKVYAFADHVEDLGVNDKHLKSSIYES
ncbi:putative F-box protein At1g30930 [Capsella rubella]|uniref:putative F-box protein At1g30930 n=1 Tax=Capsella rubella TaxID=81985 RepID=UPI000CD4E79C|nr:putative F-box protein At1g30930 [Capsella rubella]